MSIVRMLPDGSIAVETSALARMLPDGSILVETEVSPATAQEFGSGSAWIIYSQSRRKKKRLEETVRDWVDDLYAELTAPEMPAAVKKEAAAVVKPFAPKKVEVPAVRSVDWDALSAEAWRVRKLLEIWQEQVATAEKHRRMIADDEEAFMMGIV